jgi:hypothetical protein
MKWILPITLWMLTAFIWGMVVMGNIYDGNGYLPPCQTEDSSHCYWDASNSGNGNGNDLVNP